MRQHRKGLVLTAQVEDVTHRHGLAGQAFPIYIGVVNPDERARIAEGSSDS